MNSQLEQYVIEARKRNMTDATIRGNLTNAGWSTDAIDVALPRDELSIPQPTTSLGKEVLMYVISALLPPFGLLWVRNYYRLKTKQGQRISIAIIVITIVSTIINLWIIAALYQDYFDLLSSITELSY